MAAPIWQTPAGFIGSITQLVATSTQLVALGNPTSYQVINGSLPSGLIFSNTGTIYGRPFSVGQTIYSQFTVRATNAEGISDRTFNMTTVGHEGPEWLTPVGLLPAGLYGNYYALNLETVDYQLSASILKLPIGKELTYFIADRDGELPPGLKLLPSGRIIGQVKDSLLINYLASSTGGYDKEPYDLYPYDHVSILSGSYQTTPRYIPKTYQFYVSVTDGSITSRRFFSIKVEDPNNFRVDNTFINVDSTAYFTDSDYLLAPQWLTPANLGVVRADNKLSIKINVYDFEAYLGPIEYDWDTPTVNQDGTPSVRPPGFNLDTKSGIIYATIPYQPAFNLDYKFTINLIKTDRTNNNTATSSRTFNIVIKGVLDNDIRFISTSTLGTVAPGYISELKVEAEYVSLESPLLYTLESGSLPSGLTLATDGAIQGRVNYNSFTGFDVSSYGFKKFSIDSNQTTFDKFYTFTVGVGDIYKKGVSTSTFKIGVDAYNLEKYTQIYAQPMLKKDQRSAFKNFINDPYIFNINNLYRPYDKYFGIQQKLQLYIEFGIEQTALDNFFTEALTEYFSRRKFLFGNVGYSKAKDIRGNYLYDVVHVDIIDVLKNGNGPSGAININGNVVYLNNVLNMRNQLESILIEGNTIKTDEYQLPKFMRTIQPNTGDPLGYVLVSPLCYMLPGKGAEVVEKIGLSGFDFKNIDFTIDRLILQDNLTLAGAKYLMFPTKDIFGNNIYQSLSYITTGTTASDELFTEDGYHLYLE